jgi:hypothetical protein
MFERIQESNQFNERDKDVASTIADIWMARQGFDAMMFNEPTPIGIYL